MKGNKKVGFLVIGTQKGGTSALDDHLREHPEIGMAVEKELHFFDDEEFFAEEEIDYSKYEERFECSNEIKVYGESTPIYMYWEACCKRIWDYNKDMKLIAILRDPVDRAFSHWNMEAGRQEEDEPFLYCIKNEAKRLKEALPLQHRVYSYADRGLYAKQIKRYKRYFKDEQMLFIKYEDFKADTKRTLNSVFTFLGVDPEKVRYQPRIVNPGNYKQTMTQEEKAYLLAFFRNDIKELEQLLNWDRSNWLTQEP